MQSLDPRAIAITEFGPKGDDCAVAKYKTTKMAEKGFGVGFLLSYFLIEKHRVLRQSDSNLIPQKLTLLGG